MSREFFLNHLIVRGNKHSDCAHGCRYCPIKRRQSPVALERYAAVVERAREWQQRFAPESLFYHALGYHHNHDREDLEILRRLNGPQALNGLTLGGLPDRTEEELREWLGMLIPYGLTRVHATFGGLGEMHDRWNNKVGNFDLLMRTLRVAAELDLALGQRLLVAQSTLPSLEPLLDLLEELPLKNEDWRYAMPFFYQTRFQKPQPHVESDRVDEATRDSLSPRLAKLFSREAHEDNLSEREWIRHMEKGPETPHRNTVVIRVTERSIDELETRSIDDIVAELQDKARQAYGLIPSRAELMERYGDRNGTTIYNIPRCVEMKWLDKYRLDHPEVQIDQSATAYWFGG